MPTPINADEPFEDPYLGKKGINCKCWDLSFLAPSREVATFRSSLGGECGERLDSVKDASFARAGEAGASHP